MLYSNNMNARISTNHAYFYDALSGSFLPPSDPKGRTHTLARLMNATIEKGEVIYPNTHKELRLYRPSWAPISSLVHISHWDIHSMTLQTTGRGISFEHTLNDASARTIKVTDSAFYVNPLLEQELGPENDYNDLQDRVSKLAQRFFDAFPHAQIVPIADTKQ